MEGAPMNCSESIHGLGSVKDGDDTFLKSVTMSDNLQAEDACLTQEPAKDSATTDDVAKSSSIEDVDDGRISAGISTSTMATEKHLEVKQGVTLGYFV
jgi:hypothetical protein